MNDKKRQKVFMFSRCEVGISEPQVNSVLHEVRKILAKTTVHTYGNGLLKITEWLEKRLVTQR